MRQKWGEGGGVEVDELKKDIESLKRKTFYMAIAILVMSAVYASSVSLQLQRYATIQDYYYDSLENHQELNQKLWEQNRVLEEILSNAQSAQLQKNLRYLLT